MTGLQQHQITPSGLRGRRGRYTWDSPPPSKHISYKPEMVGKQYGWVKIISPERRWNDKMNTCYVLTQCTGCGSIQWQVLGNLTRGLSKGCQSCSQPRQIPMWLDRRLTAAKQRCENPKDRQYYNYGGRGIRFSFPSVTEAGLYLIKAYGLPDREMEIDRINTNGDYAPGNIRFVPHSVNCANQRRNVLSRYDPEYWPYARSVVIRKLSQGTFQGRDYPGCGNGGVREEKKLALHPGKVRVYDIRNAGRRHRFTVSGKLVHNCGYQGGTGALISMGALSMGLREEELPDIIEQWRAASPHIVQFWWDMEKAAAETVKTHEEHLRRADPVPVLRRYALDGAAKRQEARLSEAKTPAKPLRAHEPDV